MSLRKYQLFLEPCSRKAIKAFKKSAEICVICGRKKSTVKKSAPQISLTHADRIVMKSECRWEDINCFLNLVHEKRLEHLKKSAEICVICGRKKSTVKKVLRKFR